MAAEYVFRKNTSINVKINGTEVTGITYLKIKKGTEEKLIPSTTIPGAYHLVDVDVHLIEINRELFDDASANPFRNLTDFTLTATRGSEISTYKKCNFETTTDIFEKGGKRFEKIIIKVEDEPEV